jgi:hypothetical protein
VMARGCNRSGSDALDLVTMYRAVAIDSAAIPRCVKPGASARA